MTFGAKSFGILLAYFIGIILFLPSAAEEKPILFSHSVIELQEQQVDNGIITPDLDSDGINEFIIQTGRKLTLYKLIQNDKSELKIITTFQIPDEVFIYCFARLPSDKTGCLIGMTTTGVIAFDFTNGVFAKSPKYILKLNNTFFQGKIAIPLYKTFIYDSMIIVPQEGKLTIARSDKESKQFVISQEIGVPVKSFNQISDEITDDVTSSVFFPIIYLTDINNDQKNDLIVLFENYLTICIQDEKGIYHKNTSDSSNEIGIDVAVARRPKTDQDLDYTLVPVIKDINNDKLADLLVSNGSKGLSVIYLNQGSRNGFFRAQKQDYLKRINGWLISQDIVDLNNDKSADLVLVLMRKVGLTSGLRILLAHSVNWEMEIYLKKPNQNPATLYSDNPDYARTINIPFTLSLSPGAINVQTPFLLSFNCDFNQDKINDLLIKESGSNQIKIYYGNKNTVFSQTPDVTLNSSAPIDFTSPGFPYAEPGVSDFNGDGKSDIIIHQQDFQGKHHFFEFFLSSSN